MTLWVYSTRCLFYFRVERNLIPKKKKKNCSKRNLHSARKHTGRNLQQPPHQLMERFNGNSSSRVVPQNIRLLVGTDREII